MGIVNGLVKEGFLKIETNEEKEQIYLKNNPFKDTTKIFLQKFEEEKKNKGNENGISKEYNFLLKKKLIEKKFIFSNLLGYINFFIKSSLLFYHYCMNFFYFLKNSNTNSILN